MAAPIGVRLARDLPSLTTVVYAHHNMSKPTMRDGAPSADYRTCPKCGLHAIRTIDAAWDPDVEYLACDTCPYMWTVAHRATHVRSVTRPKVLMEATTPLRAPHPPPAATQPWTPEGWHCLMNSRLNALLIGPTHVTGRLVRSLRSQTSRPIIRILRHMPLVLPQADQVGTIIVEDIGRLDMAAQMYLLEWLESAVPRARVISTSAMPLLPMVAAAIFDATLYYRLNLLYVRC